MGAIPRLGGGGNLNRPTELARTLCEEYRIVHGSRRPGDACIDEFDCLPYPESESGQGDPWPHVLACVDGECREQAPAVPADYDAPCAPEVVRDTSSFGGPGTVTRGNCSNGQCSLDGSGSGRCTMQCEVDADCPEGSSCKAQAIGPIVNLYDHGSGAFCIPACRETGTCDAMSP